MKMRMTIRDKTMMLIILVSWCLTCINSITVEAQTTNLPASEGKYNSWVSDYFFFFFFFFFWYQLNEVLAAAYSTCLKISQTLVLEQFELNEFQLQLSRFCSFLKHESVESQYGKNFLLLIWVLTDESRVFSYYVYTNLLTYSGHFHFIVDLKPLSNDYWLMWSARPWFLTTSKVGPKHGFSYTLRPILNTSDPTQQIQKLILL